MNYLVAKLTPPQPRRARDLEIPGPINFDRNDVVKRYYTSEPDATAAAEELAKQNPGQQYAVFGVRVIREAKSTLIKKTLNEAGEIVLADKEP